MSKIDHEAPLADLQDGDRITIYQVEGGQVTGMRELTVNNRQYCPTPHNKIDPDSTRHGFENEWKMGKATPKGSNEEEPFIFTPHTDIFIHGWGYPLNPSQAELQKFSEKNLNPEFITL